jgi:hypothetical protein
MIDSYDPTARSMIHRMSVAIVKAMMNLTVGEPASAMAAQTAFEVVTEVFPLSAWHEDEGAVLWWHFPIEEPPYCGTIFDFDTNGRAAFLDRGHYTHWTRIPVPMQREAEPVVGDDGMVTL